MKDSMENPFLGNFHSMNDALDRIKMAFKDLPWKKILQESENSKQNTMEKTKTKYIRGVKGRGGEVFNLLKGLGGLKGCGKSTEKYGLSNYLFYVVGDGIYFAEENTEVAHLLLNNCEEVFLEPKYKYNVGDKVTYVGDVYTIKERNNASGRACYNLAREHQADNVAILEEYIEPYVEPVKTWDDLLGKPLPGFYINLYSEFRQTQDSYANEGNKNIAASEKVAKSMLAMAQISQLMPYYGGEITDEEWENVEKKYTIMRYRNKIACTHKYHAYQYLAFRTREHRDSFLANNEQLVKDYLMLY